MQIRSGDAEITYTVMGEGAPVVLLHAFPSCHELWLPVAQRLSSAYRLILPDLRAHGRSQTGDGAATMEKHAGDIARICREEKIGKAIIGGISIGGYILFEFWRRYREHVGAMLLCNTRATPDTEEGRAVRMAAIQDIEKRGPGPFLDATVGKLVGESTHRNRPDVALRALHTMRYSTAAGLSAAQRGMAARPDSVPTLGDIKVPTLIIGSDEDTSTPMHESVLMQQKIPNSRLLTIAPAGHYAIFEKSEEAARGIRAFLDALNVA